MSIRVGKEQGTQTSSNMEAANRSRPIANAGTNQTVAEGSQVHLHGHTGGPTEGDHNKFSYRWHKNLAMSEIMIVGHIFKLDWKMKKLKIHCLSLRT